MNTSFALVVYSGGKPLGFEELFTPRGFAVDSVASHKIEFTSQTFPLGGKVDRLLFTSRNAVEAFHHAGLDMYQNARVHAVGEATRETLRRFGQRGEIPEIASAEGLLQNLPDRLDGDFIFWPHGEDADLSLADELRRRGAEVYAPSIYRKLALRCPAGLPLDIQDRKYAAFSCTSGAAARWLYKHLEPDQISVLNSIPAAVLGDRTEAVLRQLGAARISRSPEASFSSLASTLLTLLEELTQRSKT
jgi:uroporphyrinogen-III synthase